jgi:hypothetical protein
MGTGRKCFVALWAGVLGISACAGDRSTSTVASAGSGHLGGLIPTAVVAASSDSGWLVARSEPLELYLYRVSSAAVELISELPPWRGVVAAEFASEVVVGGVRCDGSPCDATVAELVTVADDGSLVPFVVIERRDGPPADSDRIFIGAVTSDELWVADISGRWWVVTTTGEATAGPIPPGGELCAVGDEVLRLSVDRTGDEAAFSVARWDGRAFIELPDAGLSTADAPGPDGFCRAEGFDVPALQSGVDGAPVVARWQPGRNWTTVDGHPDVPGRISTVAMSRFSTEFAVDGDGQLLERSDDVWEAAQLSFSLRPSGPPLGLVVDRGEDGTIACVAGTDADIDAVVSECLVG